MKKIAHLLISFTLLLALTVIGSPSYGAHPPGKEKTTIVKNAIQSEINIIAVTEVTADIGNHVTLKTPRGYDLPHDALLPVTGLKLDKGQRVLASYSRYLVRSTVKRNENKIRRPSTARYQSRT